MRSIRLTLTAAFLVSALGACGSDKASRESCQQALEHLADVAEKGQNQIPRDQYLRVRGV